MTAEHNLSNDAPPASQAPSPISEIRCPKCDGTGNQAGGPEYPDFPKNALIYCDCDEGRRYRGFDHRFDNVWQNAGIPSRFEFMRLKADLLGPELFRKLQSPYRRRSQYGEFEDDEFYEKERVFEWCGSYLFWGSYGVGKTGAAIGLAYEIAMGPFDYRDLDHDTERGGLRFVTLPDLLSELRDTYNQRGLSEGDVMRKYQEPWLLVLDDLGAEHVKDMDWLRDRLFQLIGHRHAEERPTIFTSNLSPEELGERLGERIMWRLVEMCGLEHVIHMTGPNLRTAR